MSGHSKWSTIKRQKESTDKKRGQAFTKLAKIIELAARGGVDPDTNFKLRMAIEKAKSINMPKSNIERILERVSKGDDGAHLQEILFEGYAQEGVAVLVEATTDNPNRTVSDVRNAFSKSGANLGERGSVSHLFIQSGSIIITCEGKNREELMLSIMDCEGVDDIEAMGEELIIYTHPDKLHAVKKLLEEKSLTVTEAEIVWKPKIMVDVTDPEKARKLITFLDQLEDNDDVQKVYSNINIPEDVINNVNLRD